jgi:hypothetical protein
MASFTFFRLIGANLQKHATTLKNNNYARFSIERILRRPQQRANLEKAAATRAWSAGKAL